MIKLGSKCKRKTGIGWAENFWQQTNQKISETKTIKVHPAQREAGVTRHWEKAKDRSESGSLLLPQIN